MPLSTAAQPPLVVAAARARGAEARAASLPKSLPNTHTTAPARPPIPPNAQVDWKLTRGKRRPTLLSHAQGQVPADVKAASKAAFAALHAGAEEQEEEEEATGGSAAAAAQPGDAAITAALNALCVLKVRVPAGLLGKGTVCAAVLPCCLLAARASPRSRALL